MEGFYIQFDRENRRIGFAASSCKKRDFKTASYVEGPFPYKGKEASYSQHLTVLCFDKGIQEF